VSLDPDAARQHLEDRVRAWTEEIAGVTWQSGQEAAGWTRLAMTGVEVRAVAQAFVATGVLESHQAEQVLRPAAERYAVKLKRSAEEIAADRGLNLPDVPIELPDSLLRDRSWLTVH
jgi:hypothetical protein